MSILLYHGVPGTGKTTKAVYDALYGEKNDGNWSQGKLIITNVRGMSTERCINVLGDTGAEIVYQETETLEGLALFQRFFHFAPKGALFLIDEIQTLYPTSINKKWSQFDYKGSEDWRPRTVLEAFQKHRHYNWDFYVTSQDMRQIHNEVRMIIEGCWRHKNQGTVGVKGMMLREYHTVSDPKTIRQEMVSFKSVGKIAWQLYDSTATGQYTDTIVEASIFKSFKLRLLLLIISIGLYFFLPNLLTWTERHEKTDIKTIADSAKDNPVSPETGGNSSAQVNHAVSMPVATGKGGLVLPRRITRPYEGFIFYVLGGYAIVGGSLEYLDESGLKKVVTQKKIKAKFILYSNDLQSYMTMQYEELYSLGYRLQIDGRCAMRLYYGGLTEDKFIQHVACYIPVERPERITSNVDFKMPSFGEVKEH